jgi:hypothetical protein
MDNIAKEKNFGNKLKLIWIAIIIFVFIGALTAYFFGYRFTKNLSVAKSGYLIIEAPLSNTFVYIDNKEKIQTQKDNEKIRIMLSPETHSVIVGRDRYFPWTKILEIEPNKEIKINPLYVSENASGQMITKNDPEYWKIRNQITNNRLPTEKTPIISPDNKYNLYVSNNSVIAKVGTTTINVIKPETPIKNVSFYKDRSDAVVFSTANGVFVIEIDTSSYQNFMPIYKGTNPVFIKNDSNSIYILDGEALMQVVI